MTAQPETSLSVQDYLLQDQQSDEKLAYYAGTIVAQAGASARHNLIVTNLIGHMYAHIQHNGCRMFPGDMRVQAINQQVYTYPDLTIVCGIPQYTDATEMTLINPTMIIEILSPTTEARDRKEKFSYYRTIESLNEYILIAQNTAYVQRYTRQTAHFWYVHLTDDLADQVEFESIGYTLPMQAIYAGIDF